MPTTTPNYGWSVPVSTDLVKDGAVAIETLGDSIDASLVDLRGGTTGQVLAKASDAQMDFAWVAQDDSNAIQNAIMDAKGDIIGATAADTPARLAVGANGTVLTADSTTATGLKWATAGGGGKVLQAVSASYSTAVTTTSATFVNSGFTVSITPSATTSRILIMSAFNVYTAGRTDLGAAVQITRGSGSVVVYPQNALYAHYVDGVANSVLTSPHFSFLDSPATTSAITYELQYRQTSGSGTTAGLGFANQTTSLIALEIGA